MTIVRSLLLVAAAAVALLAPAPEARAVQLPAGQSLDNRSFAARGPAAFSVAVEPRGLHWGLETGFPLGLGVRERPDRTGRQIRQAGPWRLDAILNASHDREDVRGSEWLATSLRLERADAHGALWLGASRGGPREAGDPEAHLRLGAGRVQALGDVRGELSWVTSSVLFRNDPRWSHAQPESLPVVTITDSSSRPAIWNTMQGALHWQGGRVSLDGVGGVSAGDGVRARRWAQASMGMQLSRWVRALASWGERPAPSLAFDGSAQPRTMLGIQVAPWASAGWGRSGPIRPTIIEWHAKLVGPERLLVRVRARDAARVEIAGDFTDWTAVELENVHPGWWAAVIRVPAGLHRVQVRVDGGVWHAPPGLPRADPGPSGPSGALIVATSE